MLEPCGGFGFDLILNCDDIEQGLGQQNDVAFLVVWCQTHQMDELLLMLGQRILQAAASKVPPDDSP